MATSYANTGGTGARSSVIAVTSNKVQGGGLIANLVDGDLTAGTTHSFFFNNATTDNIIVFDFTPSGFKQKIDEFKWYQDLTTSHGTWHLDGFDGGAWTDLGSFTLGGATTQTQAITNSTAYIAYRLRETSGAASSACYCKEIEFKIEQGAAWTVATTAYANTLGTGNRTGTITAAYTGTLGAGTASKFVDGSSASDLWWTGSQTGKILSFDLGSAKVITELRWLQSNSATHGIHYMEASTDNVTWTQVSGYFYDASLLGFGGATSSTWQMNMNAGAWRYYRLVGPSANAGSTSSSPFLYEAEFKIGNLATITGTWASTETIDVLAIAGNSKWGGPTARRVLADGTTRITTTGQIRVLTFPAGEAAQTLFAPTQAATGTEHEPVAIAQTLFAPTQAAAATEKFRASVAQTLFVISEMASEVESEPTHIAQTLFAPTQSVTAVMKPSAVVAQTLFAPMQAANATEHEPAAITQTLFAPTQAASATENEPAAIAMRLYAPTQSATAVMQPSAVVEQTLFSIAQVAAATENEPAAIAQTLFAPVQAASATEHEPSYIDQTLFAPTQAASATEHEPSYIAQTLFAPTQSATAVMQPSAVVEQTLFGIAQAAATTETFQAAAEQTLFAITEMASVVETDPPGEGDNAAVDQVLFALMQSVEATESVPALVRQTLPMFSQASAIRVNSVGALAALGRKPAGPKGSIKDPPIHHGEVELFRGTVYGIEVEARVPPGEVAARLLTTLHSPPIRPVTQPIPRTRR